MIMDQNFPLLRWSQPVCKVIPFPIRHRSGHLRKVALQIASARTTREADHILNRAASSFANQIAKAGLPPEQVSEHRRDFVRALYTHCVAVRSKWVPDIPHAPNHTNGGGDAA
jgi:hypothetical protein